MALTEDHRACHKAHSWMPRNCISETAVEPKGHPGEWSKGHSSFGRTGWGNVGSNPFRKEIWDCREGRFQNAAETRWNQWLLHQPKRCGMDWIGVKGHWSFWNSKLHTSTRQPTFQWRQEKSFGGIRCGRHWCLETPQGCLSDSYVGLRFFPRSDRCKTWQRFENLWSYCIYCRRRFGSRRNFLGLWRDFGRSSHRINGWRRWWRRCTRPAIRRRSQWSGSKWQWTMCLVQFLPRCPTETFGKGSVSWLLESEEFRKR